VSEVTVSRLRIAALLLVAVLVESTLAPDLRLARVAPDVMVLLAVCAGLAGGPEQGAVVGFLAGGLSDLLIDDTPLGLSALACCLVGYAVGVLRANVLPERSWVLTPLVAAVAVATEVVIFAVVGDLVGQGQLLAGGRGWLVRVALIEAFFNAVLAVPVARLFDRAARGSKGAAAIGADRPDRVAAR